MKYKVTFEDGSEAYLAHYGVKGMKWKKHKAQEDGYEINADRLGYTNDEMGRNAAYAEAGLSRHMTREQAARKIAKDHARNDYERKKSGIKLTKEGEKRLKEGRKRDQYLVNSLPTRKSKKKAALKDRLKRYRSRKAAQ